MISNTNSIFEKYKLSDNLILKNRILMAPMTRRNADNSHNPTPIMADYYARRAAAGLIITEGTIISQDAIGYGNVPGIFSNEQIEKWSLITAKVHNNGGKIFSQLWHCGRVSHSSFHNGNLPIAPSAAYLDLELGRTGLICGQSREATIDEIQELVERYATAAINAIKAGFDGVELHGANGYLIDQFLHFCSNQRTDEYGQIPENMARFPLEIVKACGNAIGFDKVGIRLSPGGYLNEITTFPEDQKVFSYFLNELSKLSLSYVHTGAFDDSLRYEHLNNKTMTEFMRSCYTGTLVASGNYDLQSAQSGINNKHFELVAIGRPFIANPELINNIKNGLPLKEYIPEMLARLY